MSGQDVPRPLQKIYAMRIKNMFTPFHRKETHSYLLYHVWLLSPFMRHMENETPWWLKHMMYYDVV